MKSKIIALVFIILYFSTGCFFNTRENINKLPDKKFYFSEFQFILIGQKKETAYEFFKEFPVKKIMFMLAKEYNVTIDISDFENFIKTKNISLLKEDGSFRVAKNTWKQKKNENNKIIFIFEQDYFDSQKLKFKIALYNGDSTLKLINTDISKIDSIFNQMEFYLNSGKESISEYEEKNYAKVSPIPFIIETNSETFVTEEPANLIKIKSLIDDYVKSLDQNEKNIFKHDIIDYIYKKCSEVNEN